MSEERPIESVWTSAPDAEFDALKQLSQSPPSAEHAQALDVQAKKDVAQRAEAYRTPVTAETLRHCLR